MARQEPIDVITVFAGTPKPPQVGWWDAVTGFVDSDESVTARRREDEAAFAETPHRREYLPLLEAQHRLPGTAVGLEVLQRTVLEWLDRNPDGTVAVPAGAGCPQGRAARWARRLRRESCSPPQHADHLRVRSAVLSTLRGTDALPLLYEEVPYLFGRPADGEAAKTAARGGWRAELVSLEIDRTQKARRAAAYTSQIPHISPEEGRLDDSRILPPVERYWLLRRTSS